MRTQSDLLDAFEKAQARQEAPDFFRNLRIYEALYEEAQSLGIFPLKDPLDGIESDLHLGRRLNVQAAPLKS